MEILLIEEKVKEIIAQTVSVDPQNVTPDAKFMDDLGVDSLDAVEIMLGLQDEFGIEIPERDAQAIVSVGEVFRYIEKKVTAFK